MTEKIVSFNLEAYAEEKRKKYEELLKKYKMLGDNAESIKIEGLGGGIYEKIDEYYIHQNSISTYYITKPKYIEDNRLKAYLYIFKGIDDDFINLIQYRVPNKENRPPFIEKNLNDIINKLWFKKDGSLDNLAVFIDGPAVFTYNEAIAEHDIAIEQIEKEKQKVFCEIMKLFDKIKSLDIEKKGLETGKNNFIFCENNSINRRLYKKNSIQTDNLCPLHIEKFYFQTIDLCDKHIEKYYAVEEYKNRK